MGRPLARFTPSRVYISLTLFAVCGAVFSAWNALRWTPSWIAAGLFAISALLMIAVTLRPVVEIHETHLAIGRIQIPWREIRRIDQTGWNTPLAVMLTLRSQQRIMLLYPGDLDSSSSLLRHLRRFSREALLDGIPYRDYWGEHATAEAASDKDAEAAAPARYPVLNAEDEEEVERLFQRLKSVGHLESKNSDEK
ncbi:MAG TPA: hypothetical protein VLM42_07780 [Bryobacteraceae bacterium]|nr:hypothetical protein [Bryobacteraceae bacterium]